jgi:DNA-binding beta-propeller fold protein YncE
LSIGRAGKAAFAPTISGRIPDPRHLKMNQIPKRMHSNDGGEAAEPRRSMALSAMGDRTLGRRVITGHWWALLAGALAAAGGCSGDTLYDVVPPDLLPPTALIFEPSTGGEVQSGQLIRVHVAAADAEAGISELVLRLSGVLDATVMRTYSPPRDSVSIDTTFVVPADASGPLEVRLSARGAHGLIGEAEPVVLSVNPVDNTPPTVTLAAEVWPRLEVTDPLVFRVTARDNPAGSGLRRLGVTAIVVNTSSGDTLILPNLVREFAEPVAEEVTERFAFQPQSFPPGFIDPTALPAPLRIEVHAFAVDGGGNCAAAVDGDTQKKLRCAEFVFFETEYPVANHIGARHETMVVAGRTSILPDGGEVADLAVDTVRSRVYASNIGRNKLQTLEIRNGAWGPEVFVGSRPWGLALSRRGDSVYVANSGGTNISVVSLGGTPVEDRRRRIFTPNDALYEISWSTTGARRYTGIFHDFSDRPQFVAQDAAGRLLYSTEPTRSAVDGTIRVVDIGAGWASPEARLLLGHHDIRYADRVIAVAHVDSIKIFQQAEGDDLVEIYDHRPGFPNTLLSSGLLPLEDAIAAVQQGGSDVRWGFGRWDLDRIGLSDTTFVALSGDRQWVAFGEGGRAPVGRITFWHAGTQSLSYEVSVADIVSNASESIRGLDLNRDGTLGAARGDAAYFFTTDLRLQGSFDDDLRQGATGTVLHPRHPGDYHGGVARGSTPETIAFVGTGNHSIRIVDTVHFTYRGEIPIRDNLVGPFRSGPPSAADNQGKSCPGNPTCVVAKLYGVTDAGGVVVVNVLASDIKALR